MPGIVQLQDKIEVRFALTIYPYSLDRGLLARAGPNGLDPTGPIGDNEPISRAISGGDCNGVGQQWYEIQELGPAFA